MSSTLIIRKLLASSCNPEKNATKKPCKKFCYLLLPLSYEQIKVHREKQLKWILGPLYGKNWIHEWLIFFTSFQLRLQIHLPRKTELECLNLYRLAKMIFWSIVWKKIWITNNGASRCFQLRLELYFRRKTGLKF